MKKLFRCILIYCLLNLCSCKYEDGPAISFRSANSRIEGTYDIKKFEYGGNDSTQALKSKLCYGEIKIEVSSGDVIMNRGTNCTTSGDWALNHNKGKIFIQFTSGNFLGIPPWGLGYSANYEIIQLNDDEMVLMTNYNGTTIKIELNE